MSTASAGDATATTVYYAVPSSVVGSYTVKLNVNFQSDANNWHSYDMNKTSQTYLGYDIYSYSYTDLYGGVSVMLFQLYDGDDWKSQDYGVGYAENGGTHWVWTDVTNYNGKMFVHGEGWNSYEYDGTLNIKYHIQASNTWATPWVPSNAYEYKGGINPGWPGAEISENPWNEGWYDYTVTKPYAYIIFNNGNTGSGNQTGIIEIDKNSNEYWYTYVNENGGTTTSIGKPSGWLDDYERSGLTIGNFGTICLPFAATIEGATVYKIVSKVVKNSVMTGINLESVSSLEAGKAYIFKATANKITATTSGDRAIATDANGMLGNLSATNTYAPLNSYVVSGNEIHKVTGDAVTVGQYKAYITLTGISEATSRGAIFMGLDESTGIESVQTEKGNGYTIYNLQGQRVTGANKGLFIVNGKKMLMK